MAIIIFLRWNNILYLVSIITISIVHVSFCFPTRICRSLLSDVRSQLSLVLIFIKLNNLSQSFLLGLGHTRASCLDKLKVFGADHHLVVKETLNTCLFFLSNEVDDETMGGLA